ncbi:glutamate 5-kinase [Synechococcus sp. PCC 7335]|uniref:glutamate 5-kinase n=1 Tax=Synechococcus sp. (strain ATCC 29403 / PCC 7335) TaxID=91464 RepID=UPI00017EE0AE|nr:glutamate 5-kinase [Synechococcus sp. PCC 7335]EDX84464.1 glutamate 5-kinase [Synechococcus sp. PCC 7335]
MPQHDGNIANSLPSQTIVVKIGTSSLTRAETGHLALATLGRLVETLCQLQRLGHRIILVSSGAVGVGCARLGITQRPKTIALKQAVAAVGQGRLVRVYDDFFTSLSQPIAQVLLTRSDLSLRSRYVNSYRTFRQLMQMGIIPIVNENDTVAVDELKFGDNDTLSALVASLVGADYLFLLTDVDQLYSADPRQDPTAQPISRVQHIDQLEAKIGAAGSSWGTGGMSTKLEAAKIAIAAGTHTVITQGQTPESLIKILQGEAIGTFFEAQPSKASARKRWIFGNTIPAGRLYLDGGAIKAIQSAGKSLLPAGIIEVEGEFTVQDAVVICDASGQEIARGLVNYSDEDLRKICGHQSTDIPSLLGYKGAETVVHRDNLVLSSL